MVKFSVDASHVETSSPQRQEESEKKKRFSKRERNMVNFDQFKSAAKQLDLTYNEFCEAIGYTDCAHVLWQKRGEKIPKIVALACESLIRRKGQIKQEVIIRATDVKIIDGKAKIKEVHPGIYIITS